MSLSSKTETAASYSSTASMSELEQDQEEIIAKAKEVELFLANSRQNKRGTSFKLLGILFDLFKSELTANLALRDTLLKIKTNEKESKNIDSQLEELFGIVQEYDPSIKTLDDIYNVFGNDFSATKSEKIKKNVENLQQKREKLTAKNRELRELLTELENKLKEVEEKNEKELEEQKSVAEKVTNDERDLEMQLQELETEQSDLQFRFNQMTGKNSIERLNESIGEIDNQIEDISNKMKVLDTRHSKKVESLQVQIDSLQLEIDELRETKAQIEEQLDETHRQINDLTDPLTKSEDVEHNAIVARKKLNEMKVELRNKMRELEEITRFNDEFIKNIALLKTESDASAKCIENDENLMRELEEAIEQKRQTLDAIKAERENLESEKEAINDLELTKMHVSKENARLRKLLAEANDHSKTLKVENQMLRNSLSLYSSEMKSFTEELESNEPLSEEEISKFAEVSDAFRHIREELHMSPESTPEEIASYVLKSVSLL